MENRIHKFIRVERKGKLIGYIGSFNSKDPRPFAEALIEDMEKKKWLKKIK